MTLKRYLLSKNAASVREELNEIKVGTNGSTSQGARSKRLSRAATVAHARTERARFEVRGAV